MSNDVVRVLDIMHQNDPGEPDWSAVQEAVMATKHPQALLMELLRVQYLYAEDPSAFDDFLISIKGA